MNTMTATWALAGALALASGLAVAQQHEHHADGKHVGQHAPPADTRVLAKFPPELAEHTLANMRDHLLALQEINDALARGAGDKAASIAEQRLGMSAMRLHGSHENAKYMPEGMKAAGSAMHRAASRFAVEAQNSTVTGDLKPALGVLSEVMSACVACHAGFRLK